MLFDGAVKLCQRRSIKTVALNAKASRGRINQLCDSTTTTDDGIAIFVIDSSQEGVGAGREGQSSSEEVRAPG